MAQLGGFIATSSITLGKISRSAPRNLASSEAVAAAIPDEVHLHGYDIEKEAEAGKPVWFNFKASMDGVFEIEVHKPTANQIAELEVQP